MKHKYKPRMINFETHEFTIIRRVADERGLGTNGFSAALRMIVREWYAMTHPDDLDPETDVQSLLPPRPAVQSINRLTY